MASPVFTAGSFCSFAKTLRLRWEADETSIRTSMSRAYYGALIEARDAKSLSSIGANGHQTVLNAYQGDRTIIAALRRLKSLREKADYEPQSCCSKTEALEAITQAEKVLKALGVYPAKLPDLVPLQAPAAPPPP